MKKNVKTTITARELVKLIVDAAEEKLAENISVIQMNSANGISDFFVICQGDTTVHNQAISSGVVDSLTEKGHKPWHVEGTEDGRWILVDFSDVVVHVMLPELRDHYNLEQLGTLIDINE
ncbi:MAG TPA: ribosome silencing factor [Chitinispirillaceae bacterium]|nr:ribosome silencing factor [Chitinispirillaceae bacterium]